MPSKKPVHTVPSGKGWANKSGGETTSTHRKKSTAVEAGRKQAKVACTEHRIHGRNGQIREANSYGHDPHPPRG